MSSLFLIPCEYFVTMNSSAKRERSTSPRPLSDHNDIPLPIGFAPSNRDVVCGRSKRNYHHDGNRFFRELVASHVLKYLRAKSKIDKGCVIASVVDEVRRVSPHGGFVRQDLSTKAWYTVSDNAARDKVSATLRGLIKAAGGEEAILNANVEPKQIYHDANEKDNNQVNDAVDPSHDWIPISVLQNLPNAVDTLKQRNSMVSVDELSLSFRRCSVIDILLGQDIDDLDCIQSTLQAFEQSSEETDPESRRN